jgi:hypothetical protein
MGCLIMRRKLVTLGSMSLATGKIKEKGQEWREEPCATPIFGTGQDKVCKSCLSGWTHEHNYMLDTEDNKKLLEEARRTADPPNNKK